MNPDPHSSRARLLAAGRDLFARHGYEQTSTAAIAKQAGSSESQLVRWFGGKAGLLEAIFEEAWEPLNQRIADETLGMADARAALVTILILVLEAFDRDHETAAVFLFEGRRVRGDELALSKGFLLFLERLAALIAAGQENGSLPKELDPSLLRSALVGAAEGMVRDRLVAARIGRGTPLDPVAIRRVFEALVSHLG